MGIVDGVLVFSDIVVLVMSIAMFTALFIFDSYIVFLISIFVTLSLGNQTLLLSKFGLITFLDVSLIITILSFIQYKFLNKKKSKGNKQKSKITQKSKLVIPPPAVGCIIILIIGLSIALARYDDIYISVRSFRWAIGLPIYFIIVSNMVDTQAKVKSLLFVLLISLILSSIQHLIWLLIAQKTFDIQSNLAAFRNIGFLRNQESFLMAGPFFIKNKIFHPYFQLGVAVLFLVTFLSQQTRSVLLGVILGGILYYIFISNLKLSFKKVVSIIVALATVVVVTITAMNILGFSDFGNGYLERLSGTLDDKKSEKLDDTITRRNAFYVETNDWLSGNIIFGEGLFYYQRYGYGFKGVDIQEGGVAYGHLGYINYLSQLGLIGFIIYGLWLPISVLLKTKEVLSLKYASDSLKYIASLTGITFLSSMITFLVSSSFINSYIILPGILAGVIWRFSKFQKSFNLP